jgi:rhamnosyltransferase
LNPYQAGVKKTMPRWDNLHEAVRHRIAAVTVLYHPGPEEFANLKTYGRWVGRLYVVDNSENGENREAVSEALNGLNPEAWQYHSAGSNRGIAWALNHGADSARRDGFELLLTMDQDTTVPDGVLPRLLTAYDRLCGNGGRTGIVGAHAVPPGQTPVSYDPDDNGEPVIDFPLIIPTSGNLICLHAHGAVGGFDDGYFIDDVDFEYCLRLRAAGYVVAWMPHILVGHRWGDASWHDVLWWKGIPASRHSPLRRYYITRNRLYSLRRYARRFPEMKPLYWRMTWQEWLGILLFETRRMSKIMAAVTGVAHFMIGRTGKR